MEIGKSIYDYPGAAHTLGLDNETVLLLHCCRISLSPARLAAITGIIADGIDWDILTDKAAWHRLLPLVSSHMTTPEIRGLVPESTVEKMQCYCYTSLARNMLLQHELSGIISLLNKQSIAVIVLKGSAFLGTVYEDIALRPMSDLDILVHQEDLFRAEAIAFQKGYTSVRDYMVIEQEEKLRHLPNLVHNEKQIMLEIHKHITDIDGPYKIRLDDIWSRSCPIVIQGAPALTLSTEDHLIHLATNFLLDRRYNTQHAMGQLCDISELIIRYRDEIDWLLVEKIATEIRIRPSLFFTFYACKMLLDTPIPENLYRTLQPADFDYEWANLFLKRRVIDEKDWLIHNLVDHESDYSISKSLTSGIRRLMPSPKRLFQKDKQNGYYFFSYLHQFREKFKRLSQAAVKPSELKENLRLDQWLHDLYNDTTHRVG